VSLNPIKGSLVSLSKKHFPHCLVLVGSRNRFERDLHKQKGLFHKLKQMSKNKQQTNNTYKSDDDNISFLLSSKSLDSS